MKEGLLQRRVCDISRALLQAKSSEVGITMPVAYRMPFPYLAPFQIKTEERGPPPSYEEVIGHCVMKVIGMSFFEFIDK